MSQVRVSGNASGTGVLTVTSPNTNSNYTLTLPAQTGTILTNATTTGFPAGSVLQVLSSSTTTTFSTSSASYVDTGFTVTITPSSASNKVLVSFVAEVYLSATNEHCYMTLYRNGSNVNTAGGSASLALGSSGSGPTWQTFNFHFLDAPASASAVVYKIYAKSLTGGVTIDIGESTSLQTLTVMEIAA